MSFDMWRFLASPNRAAEEAKVRGKGKSRRRRHRDADTRLPWFVSVIFFLLLARVVLGSVALIGFARGFGDPLPAWWTVLVVVHGLAMVVALVFLLNGFGWARVALLALSLAQLAFDATLITRWFLLFDVVLLVFLVIKPANRYFTNCADVRAKG